jgi:hypothetical protein
MPTLGLSASNAAPDALARHLARQASAELAIPGYGQIFAAGSVTQECSGTKVGTP